MHSILLNQNVLTGAVQKKYKVEHVGNFKDFKVTLKN